MLAVSAQYCDLLTLRRARTRGVLERSPSVRCAELYPPRKSRQAPVHGGSPGDTSPLFTSGHEIRPGDAVVVSTGSMVSVCTDWCRSHGVSCISVPRLKPFPTGLIALLEPSRHVVVVEEHCRTGGLWSALVEYREAMRTDGRSSARITSVSLRNEFTHTCGSYQHALSEHDMGDERVRERLRASVFETA